MITEQEIWEALCARHSRNVQEKLQKARVCVAGLGGLGSQVAIALARMGVGHLHLIDFDRVDLTNLNRQQYFLRHVGRMKTEALEEILRDINPYLEIRTDCVKVTEKNLQALLAEDTIICEAFDRPEEKAMLVNGVLEHFPKKPIVSASGMAGFGNSNTIVTRQVTKNFYICGDGHSDAVKSGGLTAPRVGICACHEANQIVALILERES